MKKNYIPYLHATLFALASMWIASTYTKWLEPQFSDDDGSIKLVARALSCGSVWIKPIPNTLTVEEGYASAYLRLRSVPYLTEYQPQKTLGTAILGPEGVRPRFGWGKAFRAFSHYRIYCEIVYVTHSGKEVVKPVECKKVVTLDHIKMHGHCGSTIIPGGAGGQWKPLKMY